MQFAFILWHKLFFNLLRDDFCTSHAVKYFMVTWLLPYAVDAVPCRIAFERGKERHFSLLGISLGTSGWIVLAEELPVNRQFGVVRVAAPLAGSNVCFSFVLLYCWIVGSTFINL